MERLHRLGLFSYLNALPLLYNIDSAPWRNKFELLRQVPSVLNVSLEKNELDVASVSSSFYLTHQSDYKRLRGVSISSFGPVTSVLLVYTATWQKAIQAGETPINIGLTDQSATSVELLKWWWAQQHPWAARPVLQSYVSSSHGKRL
jgi:chorismate dehydratase